MGGWQVHLQCFEAPQNSQMGVWVAACHWQVHLQCCEVGGRSVGRSALVVL